jgi:integrase
LEPGETKNGDGRNFPLTPRLRAILQAQIDHTKALEREKKMIIPWLFHRDGKPIKTFRRSWATACLAVGLGKEVRDIHGKLIKKKTDRIPHDFRRTAIRNLERAGVSRSDAMTMVGHKTVAVYQRYAICDETSLREAAVKLAEFQGRAENQQSSVQV